jgi:hypothetical protein
VFYYYLIYKVFIIEIFSFFIMLVSNQHKLSRRRLQLSKLGFDMYLLRSHIMLNSSTSTWYIIAEAFSAAKVTLFWNITKGFCLSTNPYLT